MAKTGPRIAILGAGPIGLEAAVAALSLGLPFTVYEAGQPGEYVGRWGFAKMFSPWGWNSTSQGLAALRREGYERLLPAANAILSGKEFRDNYLQPLAALPGIKERLRTQTTVAAIGRTDRRKGESSLRASPFRLLLRGPNAVESFEAADAILDCTGTYGRPNWIGDGGIPAAGEFASRQFIPYWLEDVLGAKKANYLGKSILVLGSGYSAASTVCDLMALADENPSTWVIWLTSGPRSQPLVRIPNDPLRERDRLAARANQLATRCDGNLECHAGCRIEEVHCSGAEKGYRVVAVLHGERRTWEAERLIANVGYKPDAVLTAELNVDEPAGDIATGEPNYFILGSKSAGRRSGFLLKDGHEQISRAFATILGQPKLALAA